jgi:HK97 gp10 family phage protein
MGKLRGSTELKAKLNKMQRATGARGVTRDAVRAAARLVRDEARALLPSTVSSASRKGVITQDKNHSDPNTAMVVVGVAHKIGKKKQRPSFALLFFETGTKGHRIGARRRRVLRIRSTGQFVGRNVTHPGQRKQPFLAPALERKRGAAIDIMNKIFTAGLLKKGGGGGSSDAV